MAASNKSTVLSDRIGVIGGGVAEKESTAKRFTATIRPSDFNMISGSLLSFFCNHSSFVSKSINMINRVRDFAHGVNHTTNSLALFAVVIAELELYNAILC